MVRAGDARILFSLNRHGTLTITARRGGTVMTMRVLDAHRVELGPGRAATRGVVRAAARVVGRAAQADAVVFDGTSLAAHAADEHRRIAHEGGIRRRRHYKVFLAVALGPGDRIAIIASPPPARTPETRRRSGRAQRPPWSAARWGPARTSWPTRRTRRARSSRGAQITARAP